MSERAAPCEGGGQNPAQGGGAGFLKRLAGREEADSAGESKGEALGRVGRLPQSTSVENAGGPNSRCQEGRRRRKRV